MWWNIKINYYNQLAENKTGNAALANPQDYKSRFISIYSGFKMFCGTMVLWWCIFNKKNVYTHTHTHTHTYRLHGKCYIFGDSLTMTCFLIIILNVFSKPYETYKYKEYISRNLTRILNKIFISHFSISSSWTLIDPSINEPFSELTTAFFQTDEPHVKLILSSHGTCHTAQYEPALPIQNNINQMNWSHQR